MNLYAYVLNNPLNKKDLLGLITLDECVEEYEECRDDCTRRHKSKCKRAICYDKCGIQLGLCAGKAQAEELGKRLMDPKIGIPIAIIVVGGVVIIVSGGSGAVLLPAAAL